MGKFPQALEARIITPHAVTNGYPGPRSATWLHQLTDSLGIVTAERGYPGQRDARAPKRREIRGTP
jgi:hypothetical protein